MTSFWRVLAVLALTASAAFGQIVTEAWDVQVTNPVRHALSVRRGETAIWQVRFMDGTNAHDISASTTQTLRYATVTGAPKYYVLAGTTAGMPAGTVQFTWGPGNEASASLYEYDIAVIGYYGTMCRAKGSLTLEDSVPGNPSIGTNTAASWRIFDWLYVRNLNESAAPWFSAGGGPWTNASGTNLFWAGANTNGGSSVTNNYDPAGIAAYLVGVHSNAVVGQGYTPTGAVVVLVGVATSSVWTATTGLVAGANAGLSNAVVAQGYTPTGAVTALIAADTNHEATGVALSLVTGLSNSAFAQGWTPTNAVNALISAATSSLPNMTTLTAYVGTNNSRFLTTLTNAAAFDAAGLAQTASNALYAADLVEFDRATNMEAYIAGEVDYLDYTLYGEVERATAAEVTKVSTNDARYLAALTNGALYDAAGLAQAVSNAIIAKGYTPTGAVLTLISNAGHLTNGAAIWAPSYACTSNTLDMTSITVIDAGGANPNALGVYATDSTNAFGTLWNTSGNGRLVMADGYYASNAIPGNWTGVGVGASGTVYVAHTITAVTTNTFAINGHIDGQFLRTPTSTNGLISGTLWNSNGVAHFMP